LPARILQNTQPASIRGSALAKSISASSVSRSPLPLCRISEVLRVELKDALAIAESIEL
jgi:hypothetical protein